MFRKGGVLNKSYKWRYGRSNIEIVKSFNYLGIVLSSGGSFKPATNTLKGKSLQAMSSLLNVTRDKQVPIDIMFNLFDAYVLPILNYSCEVWGNMPAENLEIVHRKFCKWLLNVKMSTNTLSLFAEVGRFPLYISRHLRIVKYFIKLHPNKTNICILNYLNYLVNSQRLEESNIIHLQTKTVLYQNFIIWIMVILSLVIFI